MIKLLRRFNKKSKEKGKISMITYNNLYNNDNMKQIDSLGCVKVFEHQRDLSVDFSKAMTSYYASKMNIRKRQVLDRKSVV